MIPAEGPPPAAVVADPFYPLVRQELLRPKSPDWSSLILVVIIVVVTQSGVLGAAALFAAIAMRDLVRVLVMKAVDASDMRLLVLPLSRGELPIGTTPGREAAIVLCGPATLVLLSGITWFVSRLTGPGIVQELAKTSVALAAFTLLPLKPYDGWRLLNLSLFSRSAKLEMAVSALTSLVMLAFGIWSQAWFIVIFSAINVAASARVLKVDRAVALARERGFESTASRTAELNPLSMKALYEATLAIFPLVTRQAAHARIAARTMEEVHLRAARVVPSAGMTVLLLTLYGALVAYFVVGIVVVLNLG